MIQEQAKEKIKALVEKYEKIKSSGKMKSYTESTIAFWVVSPLILGENWDKIKQMN
ncbi:hypothetical protein KKA96_03225 [Patescibacteria group bacterium]|nr:hypothetical protein [Patescibacteria group bacterium]